MKDNKYSVANRTISLILFAAFFIIFIVYIASAADFSYIDTGNYILFDQGDGSYINLTGQQNFSEFNFDTLLNISINNSYSTYANTANIQLANISYFNDKLHFTASGTGGLLSVSARMSNEDMTYLLKVDDVPNLYDVSTSFGVVNFDWSSWSQHTFMIELADLISPIISIINNSITGDESIKKIFLNNSQSISFYISSNSPIDSWNWSIDNILQSNNNSDYLTTSWGTGRYHYVSVNASNDYGTSNTLTWGVNVYPAMATATIGALNESPADEIRNALENKDAPALVMATVLPFTNLIGAFFYAIVWFIVFVMMWIKQKSMNIPMVIGIIFGGLIISFLPEQYQLVATALVVLGLFSAIYVFFKGRG